MSRGKWIAAGLAIAVHLAFLLVLVFTVNWQNDRPEAVTAELYAPPTTSAPSKAEPAPSPPEPKPAPEPPRPPPVKQAPEPPRKVEPPPPPPPVVPKAVPKVEPKPALPSKADLALKEKQEQERRKKEQAERERKDQEAKAIAKREAEKKQKDEQRIAEMRERQKRESEALKAQAAREAEALKAQADRERVASERASANAAKAKADADYKRRIQAKIRGNVNLPPDIPGNPEAIFEVVQLPTGEILDAQLRKSSGVRAYDEALHRAILRSSPLPQPDSPDLFQRNLTLRFRPLD